MSQKVYIGRIFSRQVYEKKLSEIYERPFNDYPWNWPYDCDGKPVYYYTDDKQKRLYMEDDNNCQYGCHIVWTVEEEQMEHKMTITDEFLHELVDTLQKVVADKDGDMLLMSRIEYAERLSVKAASPADGYTKDFLYNIVYYAILQNLRYKTIVHILYLYGCRVTGPEVENYEFLKS